MSCRVSQSRWFLKKAARKGMACCTWASGRLAVAERAGAGPRVRVLTYHRFGRCDRDPFCVRREDFAAQMRYLAERQAAISLDDLEQFLAGEKQLPNGSVLVTVDDGFRSVLTEMLPVLRDHAIPAVAYVSPSNLRKPAESAAYDASEAYLSWSELEQVAAAGVTIGSHGRTHRSLGRMERSEVLDEAARSRDILQQRLGCAVNSLAYPFGTRADFNDETTTLLCEAGYTTGFTSQHGAVVPGAKPLELPRIKVEGGEGLWMFRLLCRGATDGWRLVDRTLWQLQHAGG